MRRTLVALSLILAACGPAAGTADASPDAVSFDAQPETGGLEAAAPDAPADAPDVAPPDTRTCATDMDRDGYVARSCGGDDCDDGNARVHPGQMPRCDATLVDSDCNGVADAMEETRRLSRCLSEYPSATGMTLVATIACLPEGARLSCRACRGTGTARQCLCWDSGESSSHACAP